MAQAKLKQKSPNCPTSFDTPRSDVILDIPLLYAVVARPMKRVMRQRRRVMKPFFPLLQLKGFSLSSSVNLSTMYSWSCLCVISVSLSGRSISTSFNGPSSGLSESLPLRSFRKEPPHILHFLLCFPAFSSCFVLGKSPAEATSFPTSILLPSILC